MPRNKIAVADDPVKALIKAIAMDIGKEVVHHVEIMYPKAIEATRNSTFKLSLRNCVYNEIIAAIEVNDEGKIVERIARRKKHRREMNAIYKKIREKSDARRPA